MKNRADSPTTAMRRTTHCRPRLLVAILEPRTSGNESGNEKENEYRECSWPAGAGSTSGYALVRLALRQAGSGQFEVLANRDRISGPLSRFQQADRVA